MLLSIVCATVAEAIMMVIESLRMAVVFDPSAGKSTSEEMIQINDAVVRCAAITARPDYE